MVNNQKIVKSVQLSIALSRLAQEARKQEDGKPLPLAWGMKKGIALALAALVLLLSGSVVAVDYFSALSGDELALRAEYQGSGIVFIYVENRSSKELTFEKKLKLMQWSTGEEIQPISDALQMENTEFSGGAFGIMTIDISQMYDVAALEEPLAEGDYYYFILTNQSFLFGNDWNCSVDFRESKKTEITYAESTELPAAGGKVYEELREFFEEWSVNSAEKQARLEAYWQKAVQLLAAEEENGKTIVSPVDPGLYVGAPEEGTVFDIRVPADMQYQLVGETHNVLDAFGVPMGASLQDSCMVLTAPIPASAADTATSDGSSIPLIYIFQYERAALEASNSCVFIRGGLYSASNLGNYLVYQDETYACYNVTELFYTNLESYLAAYTGQRDDLYLDEGVYARLRNIYEYYMQEENLEKAFYYQVG